MKSEGEKEKGKKCIFIMDLMKDLFSDDALAFQLDSRISVGMKRKSCHF